MNEKMIEIQGITKSFGDLQVLKGIDLTIYKGEVVSIVGPSGAGKTTLLQIMGTLDKADSGSVVLNGVEVGRLKEKELSAFRNRQIGFVFQFHQLLPEFTALENSEKNNKNGEISYFSQSPNIAILNSLAPSINFSIIKSSLNSKASFIFKLNSSSFFALQFLCRVFFILHTYIYNRCNIWKKDFCICIFALPFETKSERESSQHSEH